MDAFRSANDFIHIKSTVLFWLLWYVIALIIERAAVPPEAAQGQSSSCSFSSSFSHWSMTVNCFRNKCMINTDTHLYCSKVTLYSFNIMRKPCNMFTPIKKNAGTLKGNGNVNTPSSIPVLMLSYLWGYQYCKGFSRLSSASSVLLL